MQMFTKSMKSSVVIAALLTGALYGSASPAAAATGDVCVAGEIVHLTAKQGTVPIPAMTCLPPRGTPICPAEGFNIE
jgi:hypothetical protein